MRAARGFTLVEVLVALLILSIMAAMAWAGVDSLLRSREVAERHLASALRVQATLAQFEADMSAVIDTLSVPPLVFDGATLRLTRASGGGVQLVAWSLRQGRWQRWASPAVTQASDLSEIWLRSMQLLGNEPAQVSTLSGISEWQFYTFRSGGWSNAQSTGDVLGSSGAPAEANAAAAAAAAAAGVSGLSGVPGASGAPATIARTALPTGVRVQLSFAPEGGSGLSGSLIRDFMMPPQMQ